MHPEEKQFTFFKIRPQKVFSRLDFFLISGDLIGLTKECSIIPGFKTDHSSVEFSFNIRHNSKGTGYWRFDKTLLHDSTYVLKIKECITETVQDNPNTEDDLLFDIMKCNFRRTSMQYMGEKRRKDKKLIEDIEGHIAQLQYQLTNNPPDEIIPQITKLTSELNSIYDTKVKQKMLDNRTAFYEDYEKNNKFFYGQGKQHYTNNTIQELELDNGTILDKTTDILHEQKKFYEKLYSSKILNTNTLHEPEYEKEFFPQSHDIPKLSDKDKNKLQQPITQKEMLTALKGMQNDKSPGIDGLPTEFYKFFWKDIKDYLYKSYKASFDKGILSISQQRGIITLIPKKAKNIKKIYNWRPISLLNVDYKILTKMFATRIKQTLHTIIHTDQRGFIPGRYIGENIMEILSIIDKLEIEDKPGLLISIDFYKAFDTIEWSFIQKAFTFFNFPEYLTKWIRILYTNINSRIINNGHMSEGFNLTRGVRQGCPLSPCLFVIAVEILAIAIRRNSQIKGIVQNEREKKINQFADDTVLSIVAEDESLSIALTCIDQFKYVSGLSMNKNKSTIIRIG